MWTFTQEIDTPDSIKELLFAGEEVHLAYKTIRNMAVATNKQIINSDKQGITGKK